MMTKRDDTLVVFKESANGKLECLGTGLLNELDAFKQCRYYQNKGLFNLQDRRIMSDEDYVHAMLTGEGEIKVDLDSPRYYTQRIHDCNERELNILNEEKHKSNLTVEERERFLKKVDNTKQYIERMKKKRREALKATRRLTNYNRGILTLNASVPTRDPVKDNWDFVLHYNELKPMLLAYAELLEKNIKGAENRLEKDLEDYRQQSINQLN